MLIKVSGIVQGVGFRPFLYRLASRLGLEGQARNNSSGVEIEIQGDDLNIKDFLRTLQEQPPPLALITAIVTSDLPVHSESGFKIVGSSADRQKNTLISPDIAVCIDCRQEVFDPQNRRYHYPFTNCTNCGPRYTIITGIPYDRPQTSMASFNMCAECRREYENPSDRRFHAQPIACPTCGPQISLLDNKGNQVGQDPIETAIKLLRTGAIVAIKGIGGFHLAVDAQNSGAVQRLRKRKHRFEKPLALMVRDVETAEKFVYLNEQEEVLLSGLQRPIVLCRKRENATISAHVSTDNNYLGLMLPYTPLHEILFNSGNFEALVMTSANISEEPICYQNEECFQRLGSVADYFLNHDRDIYIRCDDSVLRTGAGRPVFIRRSRGYAPRPVLLQNKGTPVLAVGAHLKNCICLTRDNLAFVSQHIGDLENLATLQVFEQTMQHLQKLMEINPEYIIHDLHPDYVSTKWVVENARIPYRGLQHHYAHILSVMAEHSLDQPVIGVALDGAGYGADGTIWGGEVLICNIHDFERYAHFENIPMPGGEQAILHPWRMGVAYLKKYSPDAENISRQLFPPQTCRQLDLLNQMIDKKINSPLTSGCGRLFDAVAAILGLRTSVAYEGQAAIMLEAKGERSKAKDLDIGQIMIKETGNGFLLSPEEIIPKIAACRLQNKSVALISKSFHNRLIEALSRITVRAGQDTGIRNVALSGGCFQNMILLNGLVESLTARGFKVYFNTQVPANDGGIALGQAYWGMHNT